MGFKNTIEIITKDIQELEKIVRNFENYSRIPGIEMDLALDKTRNLYELLLMIKDFNNENPSGKTDIIEENKSSEQSSSTETKKEDDLTQTKPIQEEKVEFIQEPKEEKKDESNIDDSKKYKEPEKQEMIKGEKIKEEEITKEAQKSDQSMREKILAEKFQKPGDFLNEKIGGEKSKKDLSAKIQSSPIKSISGSMGINDKFFFIRELFHGNADNFKIAMKTLDDASNFNEAYNYLLNTFEWDMDSEEVQQLLNLIRRKFLSSGNE